MQLGRLSNRATRREERKRKARLVSDSFLSRTRERSICILFRTRLLKISPNKHVPSLEFRIYIHPLPVLQGDTGENPCTKVKFIHRNFRNGDPCCITVCVFQLCRRRAEGRRGGVTIIFEVCMKDH